MDAATRVTAARAMGLHLWGLAGLWAARRPGWKRLSPSCADRCHEGRGTVLYASAHGRGRGSSLPVAHPPDASLHALARTGWETACLTRDAGKP